MERSPTPLWQPSRSDGEKSLLTGYLRWLETSRGLPFESYPELWAWSVDDLERVLAVDLGLLRGAGASRPSACSAGARCRARSGSRAPSSRYAEHLFRGKRDDAVAIVHASELRPLGGADLGRAARADRARSRPACARSASGRGDRVVAYLPNIPETVAAFLACASIGAIWSCCSPDFGAAQRRRPLRADRAEGAARRRRLPLRRQGLRPARRRRRARSAELPTLEHTFVLCPISPTGRLDGALPGRAARRPGGALEFAQLPFDHPLWVLYSSGHDRPAEGDRPRAGRHPARAPEEARTCTSTRGPATGSSGSRRRAG